MINVMHLGLSYKCNMKCKHCFSSKAKDCLNEEHVMRAIDSAYKQGLFIVYYTYGEPLLSKCFFSVSDQLRNMGIVQVLMTNGYLIDEMMAKRIKEAKINKVFVSIDHADPIKHDRNRGVHGAFDKAVKAIQCLNDCHVSTGIATTVTADNMDSLEDIYELSKCLGVNNISFLRERSDNAIAELPKELFEQYKAFFVECVQENRTGVMFHDLQLLPYLEEQHKQKNISPEVYFKYKEMNQCHCQHTVCVEPNGDVSKCNLNKQVIGNILDQDLQFILDCSRSDGGTCCG